MKRAEIESLLPAIYQRVAQDGNAVLGALLDVMEALQERPEATLRELDAWFDPGRTPDRFVPFLARWVDLDRFFVRSSRDADDGANGATQPISTGLVRLRELVRQAAYLSKWRGTRKGLVTFLETATGVAGFEVHEEVVDGDGRLKPFHIRVLVPPGAQAHDVLVQRIIESEKPAHVTYELAPLLGE